MILPMVETLLVAFSLGKFGHSGFSGSWQTLRLFETQVLPLLVDDSSGFFVHQDFIRPWPIESLARPFAGGVDAHLRSIVRQARGVVERIHRAQRKLNVAL